MKTATPPPVPPRPVRGAASLIVVLLLFLVLSLTAAYTSRNLIFEQKTSANQARATTAFEAAEAGVEWALTQLNGGRINSTCGDSTAVTDPSFQQRYLSIAANGFVTAAPRAVGDLSPRLWPTCVATGPGTWNCSCPDTAGADPVAPAGSGTFPAFRVWPAVEDALTSASTPWGPYPPPRAALMRFVSAGCTRLPTSSTERCLDYLPRGDIGEGLAMLRLELVLRSGLTTLPSAAITARVEVEPDNLPVGSKPKLVVVNTDSRSQGRTVNTGGNIDTGLFVATTVPGTPPDFSFADNDGKLKDFTNNVAPPGSNAAFGGELTRGDRMFVNTFGMKRQTYREQPGLRTCPAPCSASAINTLLANNPNRIIWVDGDLTLDASIGTVPGAPVLLIINGDTLTLDAGVTIYGFVYMTGDGSPTETSTLVLPDAPTFIRGALVAEGTLATSYGGTPASTSVLTVTYDAPALELLRHTYGSWVRLPGSWRDFKSS
jgi:hypothetical protein